MKNVNKLPLLIASLIFILVLLIIAVSFAFNISRPDSNVSITVAPSGSKVVLDGKSSVGTGNVYIKPGEHTLTFSKDGFKTVKQSYLIKKSGTTILMGLSPSTQQAKEYVNNHQSEFTNIETLANAEYDKNADKIGDDYPILKDLPLDISPEYRIDYGNSLINPKDPSKLAIYISANSNKNIHAAIQAIYLFGYDPSDYEIVIQPLEATD